jgi:KRAB domain-containing zinc finger protein
MKFIQKNHLQEHFRRKHTDERPFACDKCDKRFSTKHNAQLHRGVHTFSKPFMCDVDGCEVSFTVAGSVLMHKRVVHEKVRKYRCEQCDRAYSNSADLNKHRRTHTGERPYACTECAKKFVQKFHLQVHYRRKHTEERPFACDKCDKRFSTKHEAQRHRSAHTVSKPFMCDVDGCEKRFTAKDNVLVHKRTVHEKVRKYRCEHCDRAFAGSTELMRHRRLHTGERPYVCKECAKTFVRRACARTHLCVKHSSTDGI